MEKMTDTECDQPNCKEFYNIVRLSNCCNHIFCPTHFESNCKGSPDLVFFCPVCIEASDDPAGFGTRIIHKCVKCDSKNSEKTPLYITVCNHKICSRCRSEYYNGELFNCHICNEVHDDTHHPVPMDHH